MTSPTDDGTTIDWVNWTPTSESVNALPFRLRQYIMELSAGGAAELVQDLAALRETVAALGLRLSECRCQASAGPVAFIPMGLLDHVKGPLVTAQLQHLRKVGWRTADYVAVKVCAPQWWPETSSWPALPEEDLGPGDRWRPGAEQALALLILIEVVGTYAPSPDGCATLAVNCNDLFAWGSADAEPLPPIGFGYDSEGPFWDLYDRVRALGALGADIWCCLRRRMRPQAPVEAKWRQEGAWTSELEALPAREA